MQKLVRFSFFIIIIVWMVGEFGLIDCDARNLHARIKFYACHLNDGESGESD